MEHLISSLSHIYSSFIHILPEGENIEFYSTLAMELPQSVIKQLVYFHNKSFVL